MIFHKIINDLLFQNSFIENERRDSDSQINSLNENVPAKKPVSRKRGRATVVTSEDHIQELSVQSKRIKKEPTEKKESKLKIKSNLSLKEPKKILKNNGAPRKRQPLSQLNYQLSEVQQSAIQIINPESYPVLNGLSKVQQSVNANGQEMEIQIISPINLESDPTIDASYMVQSDYNYYETLDLKTVPVNNLPLQSLENVQFYEFEN